MPSSGGGRKLMRKLRVGAGTGVAVAPGLGVAVTLGVDDGMAEGEAVGDGDSCAFAKLNAAKAIKTASSLFFVMSSKVETSLTT